jgi:hypothetical protein
VEEVLNGGSNGSSLPSIAHYAGKHVLQVDLSSLVPVRMDVTHSKFGPAVILCIAWWESVLASILQRAYAYRRSDTV